MRPEGEPPALPYVPTSSIKPKVPKLSLQDLRAKDDIGRQNSSRERPFSITGPLQMVTGGPDRNHLVYGQKSKPGLECRPGIPAAQETPAGGTQGPI